jgi:hypothetical protein
METQRSCTAYDFVKNVNILQHQNGWRESPAVFYSGYRDAPRALPDFAHWYCSEMVEPIDLVTAIKPLILACED